MIVNFNGSSKDKEAIVQRFKEFLEMCDKEDEEIKFSVSLGQANSDKFRLSNAINGLEEFSDNHMELLEGNDMYWNLGETLEELEHLNFIIDERDIDE